MVSMRTVHLPKFLMFEIKTYIDENGLSPNALLFRDPDIKKNSPYSQRKIQYIHGKICKKAGLTEVRVHDLRHTYATIMLMAHQSVAFVQAQLGHRSIKTTIDIYGHWIPAEGRYNIEKALQGEITGITPPK